MINENHFVEKSAVKHGFDCQITDNDRGNGQKQERNTDDPEIMRFFSRKKPSGLPSALFPFQPFSVDQLLALETLSAVKYIEKQAKRIKSGHKQTDADSNQRHRRTGHG